MHPLDWQRRGRTREPDDGPPATRLVGHLLEGRGGRVGSMDRFFFGLGRLGIVLAERHTGPPFQGVYVRSLEAPYPCIIFEPAAHSSPCVASRLFVSWKEDTHSQIARATRQQSSIISSVFCSSRRPMHPGLLHIHRGEYTIMNHSSEINRRSMAMAIANPPSSADNASATNLKTLAAGGG